MPQGTISCLPMKSQYDHRLATGVRVKAPEAWGGCQRALRQGLCLQDIHAMFLRYRHEVRNSFEKLCFLQAILGSFL